MSKEINESLKQIARSSIIFLVGAVFSKILGYIYRIIIARQLGPEIYGLFSLAIMLVGWLIAFSSFGLAEGILRYIPIYRARNEINKIRHVLRFSVKVSLITSIASGLFLFFFAKYISNNIFHNNELSKFLYIFAFMIPISVFSILFLYILRAYERIGWYSFILNILQNIVKVGTLILLIYLGFNSEAVIFSYLLGVLSIILVAYLVSRYSIKEVYGKVKLKFTSKISKELLSYSWPIIFFGVISNIFYWIDSFTIGYFRTVEEVGFYNAAVPISLILSATVPELFIQLFFPLISKEYGEKNLNSIKILSKQVGKWIFILNTPLFLLIMLFPGAFINLLFGAEYLVAENSLRILAVGGVISSIFMISNNIISMVGKSKIILFDMIIASVINGGLNLFFVPRYGVEGAALATTISVIVLNILFLVQAYKITFIIPIKRETIKIGAIALIPTIIIYLIRTMVSINIFSLTILVLLFGVIYLILILTTKCLDEKDWMIIKSIYKRKEI